MVLDDPPTEPNPHTTEEGSAPRKSKPKDPHPIRMVTVFILCALSHIITLKYVSSSGDPSVESNKWKPRDLLLPRPPIFTDLQDGDLDLLDKLLVVNYLSVVVYYAPWSRASQKVLDNMGEVSPFYYNISFIGINCWLYKSLCKEAYNSWEYPQIVMYHKVLNHTPYIYGMSTYPPALTIQLQRLVNPVINVRSYEQLTNIAMAHQQTVIGYFDSTDTAQLEQYTKAAVQHHLEHMDAYYIPFISVTDEGLLSNARITVTPIIFVYHLFKPLEEYDNTGSFFTAKALLNWISKTRSLITYLDYRTFPSTLSLTKQSIIFASPLANNTQLYQEYMRFVMSYRHCATYTSKNKLVCDQNRTCINPCTIPYVSSHRSIISCLQNKPADHHIKQCFSLNTRSSHPSYSTAIPKRTSDTLGVLGEDCPLLEELHETKRTLAMFLRMRESHHVSSVHGMGCKEKSGGPEGFNFYALDSVLWSDMLGRFGIVNSSRSTEGIIKLNAKDKTVQRYTLDDDSVSYETFLWGENSDLTLENSGRNKMMRSQHIEDINKERLEDLLEDQVLDVLVFTYTPWCGFCKTLWVKVESLAVLLEQNINLRFVSINIDQNDLDDVDIDGDKVPGLYFSVVDHDDIVPFPDNVTLTLTNILNFIKRYVPVIKTKPRGRFPEFVSEPCGRWRPLVVKPSEPITWPRDLGLSDYSIFDVLEDEEDYTVIDLNSGVRDNKENEEAEEIASDEATSKANTSPTCDLDKYIIKLLAQHNSDPDKLPGHLQRTLVSNLISHDCLTGEDEFWEGMIIECYNSIVGHACDHLMMSHMIQQHHNQSPVTVTTVLKSLGRNMFDVLYCYDSRFELYFYLNSQCSRYCGRVCRLIYKLG